jgi:RND family efflux transporter MFP subunit
MLITRITIVAALALSGCAEPQHDRTAPPEAHDPPPPVTDRAPPAPSGWIGVVAAAESADLAAGAPGEIVEVRVRPGDAVDAGDVIAVLDDVAAREALAIARAELSAARAARRRASVGVAHAKHDLDTNAQLADAEYIARAQVDGAAFEHDSARAARSQASADVAEVQARIARLKRIVDDTSIRAPFSGTISLRYRDPGSVVGASTPLVRVLRSGALQVTFAVSHADAGLLAPGQTVVVVPGSESPPLNATVTHIAPEVDPASQMVFVRADLPLNATHLRSGEPARVRRR